MNKSPALTPEQARLLRRALRPKKAARCCASTMHDKPHNLYIARKGMDEDTEWGVLARDGYAVVYRDSISWRDFRVTDAGKAALQEYNRSHPEDRESS